MEWIIFIFGIIVGGAVVLLAGSWETQRQETSEAKEESSPAVGPLSKQEPMEEREYAQWCYDHFEGEQLPDFEKYLEQFYQRGKRGF